MTHALPRPPARAEPAHLGWRLLALIYDSLPLLALMLLVSAIVLLLRGGVPVPPWSVAFWLQALALWLVAGAYSVLSWQRGGQTLGMRPWRLRVVALDGGQPSTAALWRRYLLATPALAAAGVGLWWSLFDPERRCLHDIGSATRTVRLAKN
jgi:uncharacterized RDD family membrane protein YckC